VAVENDYNLLVANLNFLAENIDDIRQEVEKRLQWEKREGLEPDATHWVNLIAQRLPVTFGPAAQLEASAWQVLRSRSGEAVFEDQQPEAPDAPP
jgi:hypothetical protein